MTFPKTAPVLTVEDWMSVRGRLIWCYEGPVDAKYRRYENKFRCLNAWWLRKGSVLLATEAGSWRAKAGDWLFSGPHTRRQHFSEDALILSLSFLLDWPSGDSLVEQNLVIQADDFPDLAKTARPLRGLVRRHFPGVGVDLWSHTCGMDAFFQLQERFAAWIRAYLRTVQISGEVSGRTGHLDGRVREALRRLDRLPWTEPFREKVFARGLNLSPGHLDRLFVQHMSCTPRAYLQKRRLESALSALRETEIPVKTIAYNLGFSSPSHFTHWLRRAAGQSPREVREAKKG